MKSVDYRGKAIAPQRPKPLALALHLLLLGLAAPLAQAQDVEERRSRSRTSAQVLDTVEVTGKHESYVQKQSAASTGLDLELKETPQSVSVITQERMRDQQMTTVGRALQQTVGLTSVSNDDNRVQFVARGFTIENFQIDGGEIVSSNVLPDSNLSSMYERIEIIKGATGLLTGTGDPSATINMVRKRARDHEFAAEISANAGSWNTFGFMADISNLLPDPVMRNRIVVAHQRGDGFMDFKKQKQTILYGVFDADLGPDTVFSMGLSHDRKISDGSHWGMLPIYFSDGTRTNWRRSQTMAARWNKWDVRQTNTFAELKHTLPNDWQWDSRLNYTQGYERSSLLWMVGDFLDRETGLGYTSMPYLWLQKPHNTNLQTGLNIPFQMLGFEQHINFKLHFNRLSGGWFGGGGEEGGMLNADEGVGDIIGNIFTWDHNTPAPIWGDPPLGSKTTTTKKAISFASRLQLAEPLKLILGGRYTQWEEDNDQADWTPEAYTVKENAFTPYVGVVYDLSSNLSAYASYTNIFKPQEARDRNGRQLDPVLGNSYEIGLKSSWFDDQLMATAAVYQTQQDNYAVPDPGHFVPGTTAVASRAIKGAKVKGYELELAGSLTEFWDIGAGWSQYSAKDPDGTDLSANQPRKTFKLFTTYDLARGLPGLKLGGGVNWFSKPPAMLENPATGIMEAVGNPSYAVSSTSWRATRSIPSWACN